MIEVKAVRKIKRVEKLEQRVNLYGFDRLTPRAARAALEIAFGDPNGGEVWFTEVNPATGQINEYGYSVYPGTIRRITPQKRY